MRHMTKEHSPKLPTGAWDLMVTNGSQVRADDFFLMLFYNFSSLLLGWSCQSSGHAPQWWWCITYRVSDIFWSIGCSIAHWCKDRRLWHLKKKLSPTHFVVHIRTRIRRWRIAALCPRCTHAVARLQTSSSLHHSNWTESSRLNHEQHTQGRGAFNGWKRVF